MKKLIILILLTQLFWTNEIQCQCLQDGITFTTQSQINSFQIDYPGCTKIIGDVRIVEGFSGAISNLNGLSILNSIDGNLIISSNDDLIDLNGLGNLDSIGGNLEISFCISLTDLNGLQELSYIGGGFILWVNDSMLNIEDLDELSFIGDYLVIGTQESLTSLAGLENIDTVNMLEIYDNASLTNLIGLESLSRIEGNCKIDHNNALINLVGLDSLYYVEGNVQIKDNYHITNLNGLENLTHIGGNLDIGTHFGGQKYFKTLTGLEKLDTIGGFLQIAHNDSLTTISSLHNLTSIGYNFSVYYNNSLISIDSLWNLESIGNVLEIGFNQSLYDINSLANIDAGSIGALRIKNNIKLSQCDIESICEFISIPESRTYIHDNAPGCSSREEVEYACLVGEFPYSISDNFITIYPNPTSDKLNYSSPDLVVLELNIYNQLGQKVLANFHPENTIEISSIKPGLYIVEFVTPESRFKQKLIIE